jgi:beta-glucanase (GH16 family)
VEARIKIVNVSGFFGAFWMLPCKTNFVAEWEIDILEVLGHDHNNMFQTYHYREGLPYNLSRNDSWSANWWEHNQVDYSTDYHTYGVDWQPDRLAFYIDGVNVGTFPDPGTDNTNIPRTEGFILIQQMVENTWIRDTGHLLPDPTSSVDTFHVDYVRVWQGVDGSAVHDNRPGPEPAAMTVSPNPMRDRVVFKAGPTDRGNGSTVTICDQNGQLVRRISGRDPAWDGRNEQGQPVRPGLYFYSMFHNGSLHTGRIMRVE